MKSQESLEYRLKTYETRQQNIQREIKISYLSDDRLAKLVNSLNRLNVKIEIYRNILEID